MSFDADLTACADLVRQGDPDRFATVMAAPVAARRVLFPLYAFNVEISRAPWVSAEPMIVQMRLQWWADALDEIAAGGLVRRHFVVTPLALVLDAQGGRLLQRAVEARRRDVERAPFDTAESLLAYLGDTGGALMAASARALGAQDLRAAEALGTAAAVASWLQAVPELEARGRLPLPDGRSEAVRGLARAGRAALVQARRHRGGVAAVARPALWPGALAGPLLRRALSDPGCVARGTLALPEVQVRARRLWVAATGRF